MIGGTKGRPLRIAYARVFHEGNAFSPLPTTQQSFNRLYGECPYCSHPIICDANV